MGNVAALYEALGMEMPKEEPESENTQEAAEPAETGENEQEPAEPAAAEEPGAEDVDDTEQEPEKKEQTKQERAENARRRRQKEIDDAVKAAVAAERASSKQRLDAFFKQARMKNQHNGGSEILSLEDAEAWAQADRMARVQANLKKGQLTAEDMQALIEESPAVKALQESQSRQEQQAKEDSRQRFAKSVETELAQIRKLNPKVQSLKDILAMDTGKQWAAYVQHNGMSYLDAYKLANYDQLVQMAQQAATAGAKVREQGKSHLKPDTPRGQGAVEVPKRIKDNYRIFQPEMTDAEIEADYRKWMQDSEA